jgi:SAM-dependent methyltransferase
LRATGPHDRTKSLSDQLDSLVALEGPYPVSAASVDRLLIFLRALARKRLDGRGVAATFGPEGGSHLAAEFVSHLVSLLAGSTLPPRASVLRAEWYRAFGSVYVQDAAKARDDARTLCQLYGVSPVAKLETLLFAIQTYYALLMKLLAIEVLSLQAGSFIRSQAAQLASTTEPERRKILQDLEAGDLFRAYGIDNFLEADYFAWYLDTWDADIDTLVRRVAQELGEFEPATSTLDPEAVHDLLKVLYQYLVPKKIRHDLGEYYTPDWLADYVLDQAGFDGRLGSRFLDPGCGSGTFLMRAILRIKARAAEDFVPDDRVGRAILDTVVGFDLNPVAVLAARTNYLLALGTLIRKVAPVSLPVYLADSLLAPLPYSRLISGPITAAVSDHYVRLSSEGPFNFPSELADADGLMLVTDELKAAIRSGIGADGFIDRIDHSRAIMQPRTRRQLASLYEKVAALEAAGKNHIWATLLRNAFAPAFAGRFDFVVGNPPWINWESLSDDYRKSTRQLWALHGLFTLKGLDTLLGGSKRDLAMLFWACGADYYLASGGVIAFLMPQTVLHTSPAGDGFRRFTLADSTPVGIRSAADLVDLQPFEGASNWTGMLVGCKGSTTAYPVPYSLFTKTVAGAIPQDASRSEVTARTRVLDLDAAPAIADRTWSPWVIGYPKAVAGAQKMAGRCAYEAKSGFMTWADGIYYGSVKSRRPDGLVVFENDPSRAKKRKPPKLTVPLEPDFVYPCVEWRDIQPFSAPASSHVLIPQDPVARTGYSEALMQRTHPKTYDYLARFRSSLEQRADYIRFFKKKGGAFYSIFGFGHENLAPVRVVWATMGSSFRAAVIEPVSDPFLGDKPPLHKNTSMFTVVGSAVEGHYLCALLNSTPLNYLAVWSSVRGGKSFGAGSLLDRVRIERFTPSSTLHSDLADASALAHRAASAHDHAELAAIRGEIDALAAGYWGLDAEELREMARLMEDVGRQGGTVEAPDEEDDAERV